MLEAETLSFGMDRIFGNHLPPGVTSADLGDDAPEAGDWELEQAATAEVVASIADEFQADEWDEVAEAMEQRAANSAGAAFERIRHSWKKFKMKRLRELFNEGKIQL